MSTNVIWDQLSASDWQQAMQAAAFVPLQQNWGYAQAVKAFGGNVTRAALYCEDALVGLAQIQTRKLFKLLPLSLCLRGPVWLRDIEAEDKAALYYALIKQLPLRKPRIALWMPQDDDDAAALSAQRCRQVVSPYHTALLDLQRPLEQLREHMDSKWRNRLVAAEGSALKINQLNDYRFLLEQEAQQSARIGYAALHPMMVPAFQFECGQDSVLCLAAMQQREAIAAVLVLIHDQCATYHIGWSSDDGKRQNAHNLLMWHAVKQLKARGIKALDLGGLHTDADGAGIARFKIGMGAKIQTLSGTYF